MIGGGNTAVDVAREAVRLGAEVVALLYRRTEEEMPAYAHEVAEAREEGVRVVRLTAPVRFVGSDRLEGVECVRMRLGARDESGRRRPEPIPGTEYVVPADTAVKAIGQAPRSELLSWVDGLVLERGRIRVDPETGRTGEPRYFAAGDAVSGGATVVEAVARREARRGGDRRRGSELRDDRDPLARTRRTGREDRGAGARAGAARLRQERPGLPRVRARAARRAGARLHPRLRAADPPARLRSPSRTWSSCWSRRSSHDPEVLAGMPEDGIALLNAEEAPPELRGDKRLRCVPATGSRPSRECASPTSSCSARSPPPSASRRSPTCRTPPSLPSGARRRPMQCARR